MSDAGTKPDADKPAAAADPPAAANGSVEPPLINISKGIYIYIFFFYNDKKPPRMLSACFAVNADSSFFWGQPKNYLILVFFIKKILLSELILSRPRFIV